MCSLYCDCCEAAWKQRGRAQQTGSAATFRFTKLTFSIEQRGFSVSRKPGTFPGSTAWKHLTSVVFTAGAWTDRLLHTSRFRSAEEKLASADSWGKRCPAWWSLELWFLMGGTVNTCRADVCAQWHGYVSSALILSCCIRELLSCVGNRSVISVNGRGAAVKVRSLLNGASGGIRNPSMRPQPGCPPAGRVQEHKGNTGRKKNSHRDLLWAVNTRGLPFRNVRGSGSLDFCRPSDWGVSPSFLRWWFHI